MEDTVKGKGAGFIDPPPWLKSALHPKLDLSSTIKSLPVKAFFISLVSLLVLSTPHPTTPRIFLSCSSSSSHSEADHRRCVSSGEQRSWNAP